MNQNKRLFLIDAFALIFRGYYAFIKNPRINSKGLDTSAIFGFMNSLLDLIRRENPEFMSVCFDKGGSKTRSEIFPEYKSNRLETPEAIKIAVPYIQKILNSMNIPVIEKEGFEADDIIGTLAKKAEKEGYKIYMVTPDKDFAQLVTDNILIYRPARMGNGIEIWGVNEVKNKFEIDNPNQVIDYLGMMGDSVDNIPGLPGVGDKTAKKFIKLYGSMEKLLQNTHELKGKLKEKIEENKEIGMVSKELAKILLDVPVNFDETKFKMTPPNFDSLNLLLEELEFKRMKDSFNKIYTKKNKVDQNLDFGDSEKINNPSIKQLDLFSEPGGGNFNFPKNKKETDTNYYQYVNENIGLDFLINKILKQKKVAFKINTENLNPLKSNIVGISFSWNKGKGYYIKFPTDKSKINFILKKLKKIFINSEIEKIGHDIKFDLKILHRYDIDLNGKVFDTIIAHYLINPDRKHDIEILSKSYLNLDLKTIKEFKSENNISDFSLNNFPIEKQTNFFVQKVDYIFQLKEFFENELKDANNISLFENIEIPLLKVLYRMETQGVKINIPFLNKLSIELSDLAIKTEKLIFELAGENFNIGSPKQLGIILFEKLKLIDKPKKTKTGQYSTAEEILSSLEKNHEIISKILHWRSIKKLLSTYVDTLPMEVNSITGRIHTEYNQATTSTGRLSSNSPNLQNIPIRTKLGEKVRKAFVSRNNEFLIMAADYSQIELRIIASLSNDPVMIKSFKNNQDIHASTAANVYDIPIEDVTRIQRNNAKTVNFGIIYGVSAFGLSQQTDLSRENAKKLIEKYYETYPNLKNYMRNQISYAREKGYVETVLGRRRYLRDINSQNAIIRSSAERNAVNAPIQGSAADIIKIAMIKIGEKLYNESWESKMIIQVHDELVFDVKKQELEKLQLMVKKEMENAFKLNVPLVVDIGVGENWLEAH